MWSLESYPKAKSEPRCSLIGEERTGISVDLGRDAARDSATPGRGDKACDVLIGLSIHDFARSWKTCFTRMEDSDEHSLAG